MIKNIYLIGEHIQALGVARLAQKCGLPVTLFIGYDLAVPRFSNSVKTIVKYKDRIDLLDKLLHAKIPSHETLLIPTNDEQIEWLKSDYEKLTQIYFLSIAKPEITDICHNKIATYKCAMQSSIPIPKSWFFSSEEELNSNLETIEFPVIIKPAIMFKFFDVTGKKAYLCHNKEELLVNYKKAQGIIPTDEIIIQKFLQGGAKNLYSFGAVAFDGKIYAGFMANRIRQKPMDFGISTCFAISKNIPELEEYSIKIMKEMNYYGFAEIEFMFDESIGEFLLLEINPRTWKWHSMANILGLNLLSVLIRKINGEEPKVSIIRTENLGWIERVTDFYIVISEIVKGRYSVSEWWQTYKIPKESAVWSIKDPLPAIMYLLLTPYLYLKRN